MSDNKSYEELKKHIAELEQKNAQIERSLKKVNENRDLQSHIIDVFRSTPQMMAISNLSSGKYVEVNDAILNTLGYNRSEIIGKSSDDINLFADLVQSDKFISKLARLKKVKNFEVTIKTKNNKELEFLFSAEPLNLGDDHFLLTTYQPLPHSKQTETVEMSQSLERLRSILESLSNFLMVILPNDKGSPVIEYINPRAREFSSFDKESLKGANLNDLHIPNKQILLTLISKIHISGFPQRQTINEYDKEDEGYYFGFKLNTDHIIVIWEPATIDSFRAKEMGIQGEVFEKFANMLPNVVFEINMKGKVTFANDEGLKKFGYTREDLNRGISVRDIFREADLPAVFENLKKIAETGFSSSNEYTVYDSKGNSFPVLAHTSSINDYQGKLIGFRGILTDLSEKIRFQEQILKEKLHLETLIQSAPESIVQTTGEGIIERINAEFTKEFGFTEEECIGKNIDDLIIPEGLQDEGSNFTNRAHKNETIKVETYRKKKNGELISVSALIKPVTHNDKTTSLYAIYRNISEDKRNSDLKDIILNISNAALKQSEFDDMFSTFQVEIGKLWNTTNFYIALYDSENDTLSLPFYADEKDRFEDIPTRGTLTGWLIKHGKAALLELPDIEVLENNNEVDLIGTPCQVWLGVPLVIDDNIIGAMVLQDYDDQKAFNQEDLRLLNLIGNQIALVIQRKELMENLIAERKRAEEAARLKQQFMSTMSHEIRTPLNEVIGLTNLLLQGNPRADQMEFIKTLRFSGNHLLTLVNDVLDFNKMESGMIVFEKTQFSFRELMKELKRTYSFRAEQKGVEFRMEYSNEIPDEIIGDPIRLNQILSNLISNATKFTKKGYIKIAVKEHSRKGKLIELEFAIEDSGIGIPEDKLETIFESYTQATEDTTRKYGGTGLGLSIVKKLIELQGRSIRVESKLDKGSVFIFSLPFAIGKSKSENAGLADQQGDEQFTGLNGKRILIAEDNKINFFVVSKFLIKWGVEVSHALNGKIALDLLKENEYDLILMDLHMPEMDGIEATQHIRESKNKALKDIPIIALTAAIMSETEDKIEGLAINDYILKPFKPQELYSKIFQNCR